jgi:hypothetical protein
LKIFGGIFIQVRHAYSSESATNVFSEPQMSFPSATNVFSKPQMSFHQPQMSFPSHKCLFKATNVFSKPQMSFWEYIDGKIVCSVVLNIFFT